LAKPMLSALNACECSPPTSVSSHLCPRRSHPPPLQGSARWPTPCPVPPPIDHRSSGPKPPLQRTRGARITR